MPSVKDNIFRVEISSKGALEFYSDFGTVKDVPTSNKDFITILEHHKLHLDFVPKEEYWDLVTSCFTKEKNIYLSDSERQSKDYPHYITRKQNNIFPFLEKINENGASAAHKENDELYNDCVEFTSKLGISVIYTKLDKKINFFERIYRRDDTDKIFLREKQVEDVDVDVPKHIHRPKSDLNKNYNLKFIFNVLKDVRTYRIMKLVSTIHNIIAYYKRE